MQFNIRNVSDTLVNRFRDESERRFGRRKLAHGFETMVKEWLAASLLKSTCSASTSKRRRKPPVLEVDNPVLEADTPILEAEKKSDDGRLVDVFEYPTGGRCAVAQGSTIPGATLVESMTVAAWLAEQDAQQDAE